MLKSYDELRKIDITKYTDKRDNIDYLNWAKCIDLLHENGAESVYFIPLTNEHGSSLFMSEQVFKTGSGNSEKTNRCYETKIEIHIDDKVYYMQSPVTNGANPVQDNSMTQQRVWNSMCRSFVKAVAIYTGLGFDLWLKGEKDEFKNVPQEEVKHDIMKVRDRVFEKMTELQKSGLSADDIAAKLNVDRDSLEIYLKQYVQLAKFEKALFEL